jgi:hypothetical protein
LRGQKGASGSGTATAQQLAENKPAPAVSEGAPGFAAKESEFQINAALRSLLSALQTDKKTIEADDEKSEKPRRVLLCLCSKRDAFSKVLTDAGF